MRKSIKQTERDRNTHLETERNGQTWTTERNIDRETDRWEGEREIQIQTESERKRGGGRYIKRERE